MQLPEIVAMGIYDSEIYAKNTVISKNRKPSSFEIELPMEKGGVSYIDSNSKSIDTNMIICAKPGQTRHTKFPYKCRYVHMIVESGPLYNILINSPDFFETDKADTYRDIFEKLLRHFDIHTDNEEIILQSLLLKLIYTINKDTNPKNKGGTYAAKGSVIEKALIYIQNNLTEKLSLKEVSGAMSLSPIHFHNTFKTSVGKTLRDYIEDLRIKKAINLLIATDYPLTKIAFECGFSSQSYFSYVFKRRMKKTPREYAKEVQRRYEI